MRCYVCDITEWQKEIWIISSYNCHQVDCKLCLPVQSMEKKLDLHWLNNTMSMKMMMWCDGGDRTEQQPTKRGKTHLTVKRSNTHSVRSLKRIKRFHLHHPLTKCRMQLASTVTNINLHRVLYSAYCWLKLQRHPSDWRQFRPIERREGSFHLHRVSLNLWG